MTPELAIDVVRHALLTSLWTMAPLLLLGVIVGVAINVVQVATSLQDSAFSTVPRLGAFLCGFLLLMPWMLNRLIAYAVSIFGDLGRYAH